MPFNSLQYQKRRNPDDRTCFICRKMGHLTQDCTKGRIQSSSDQQFIFRTRIAKLGFEELSELSEFQPVIMCQCGESRRQLIAKTVKNCGKVYYQLCSCGDSEFKWDYQVEADEKIWVPICKCKAGFCRVYKKKFGPNARRNYFICCIKQGQGQCEFSQLVEDTVLQIPMIYDEDEISSNSPPADVRTGNAEDTDTPPRNHESPQPPPLPSSLSSFGVSKIRKRLVFEDDSFVEEEEDAGLAVKNGKRPCYGDNSFPGTSNLDECFTETAKNLQNKLISVLESMDIHNHKAMAEEANNTFDTLNQSKIMIQPSFRLKVDKFIECASSLSRIECSVSNREKERLERAKVMADLEACKRRIEILGESVTNVQEKLFEIETELFCRKTENEKLESKYAEVSKDESVLKQERVAAFKDAKILLRS